MKPGIYGWISNFEYHTGPGISNSDLVTIEKETPADLKFKKDNPESYKPTVDMNKGQAFHTLVLEPIKFPRRFNVLKDTVNLRTKEGRAERDRLDASDKILLREADLEDVYKMVEKVKKHPMAGTLLNGMGAKYEESIYWKDPVTGLLLKTKPDIRIEGFEYDGRHYNILVDLKKCGGGKAHPKQFPREVYKYFYHQQAALYLEGAKRATGLDYNVFMWIACEDTPPYKVGVYMADAEMIQRGNECWRRNLSIIAECISQGDWPEYEAEVVTISLPQWGV